MSFQTLPGEILLQIFRHCSSIPAAINLSLTCHRLYALLRDSQKLPVLFSIAESVWGPIDDIFQLLTYNSAQPAHVKRNPVLSFALLVQISRVGRVAAWYEQMYPQLKWDGARAHSRRHLTPHEAYALRRAIYRSWLYAKAFHSFNCGRSARLNPALVAERCQLLRSWSSDQLFELEDLRLTFENILARDICPTDGDVYWRLADEPWGKNSFSARNGRLNIPISLLSHGLFHNPRDTDSQREVCAPQLREQLMSGWGDEIEQYHALNDLLKLTPVDIMHLYENAITKQDVENFVEDRLGDQWFWNNGETMLHTWIVILHSRGIMVEQIRAAIIDGSIGITNDK